MKENLHEEKIKERKNKDERREGGINGRTWERPQLGFWKTDNYIQQQ